MFFTQFGAEAIARLVQRAEAAGFPASWSVALHTADPGPTGSTADEVSTADWSNYVRQTLTRNVTDWGAGALTGSGYRIPNAVVVDFGNVTLVNPVTLSYITLRDGSDNGWMVGQFATPIALINGQPFQIPADSLGLTWLVWPGSGS